jgi:pilus assembly protein CpaB
MRANIFRPLQLIARLANDSDKARINSAFAFFSMKRRMIAAMLAILGVLILVGATRGSASASVKTLVATHEIVSGAVITNEDVSLRDLPIHLVADGSFHSRTDAIGQIAVGAIRRGEVITDARVVAPSLLSESGLVAIAITLNDSANAQLVHAGDRVDVLASRGGAIASDGATPARLVASDVEVLSTKTHESSGVVVLAVTASDAQAIAGVDDRITLVLRGL